MYIFMYLSTLLSFRSDNNSSWKLTLMALFPWLLIFFLAAFLLWGMIRIIGNLLKRKDGAGGGVEGAGGDKGHIIGILSAHIILGN